MERTQLGKNEWLRAARIALLHGGPGAVRVEPLARSLGVTKGSFYWHFRDRNEILETLLREWEEETTALTADALKRQAPCAREALVSLLEEVKQRVFLSEKGDAPSDAAIFTWAAVSPEVRKRVIKTEERRLELLTRLSDNPDRAEYAYLAFIGFLMRRRRVPEVAESFSLFADMTLDLLIPASKTHSSKSRKRVNK
jgi:AcrR family transcriptional regulator